MIYAYIYIIYIYPWAKWNIIGSGVGSGRKIPFCDGNCWFCGSIKRHFLSKTRMSFFRDMRYITLLWKAWISVSNLRYFSMYIVYYIMHNVCLNFKQMHNSVNMLTDSASKIALTGQIHTKWFPPFQNFADLCWKMTHFYLKKCCPIVNCTLRNIFQ